MLNFSGDQFSAAGFTFLLFNVFDAKVISIYQSELLTLLFVSYRRGLTLMGFRKQHLVLVRLEGKP